MTPVNAVRQAWITGPSRVEVREAQLELGDLEVLVRTERAGICGSDIHTYRHGHAWLGYPVAPGHEASGVVHAVGPAVDGLSPGDRVVLQPVVYCGECRRCRTGRGNLCEQLVGYGAHKPGGAADVFVVLASAVRKIPDDLDLGTASLIEPVACVTHAVERAGGVEGQLIAVLGAGTIGQCLTAVAVARGASKVVTTARTPNKLAIAKHLGASEVVIGSTAGDASMVVEALGGPADVVFDCASTEVTVAQSMNIIGPGASIIVVGCRGPRTNVDWNAFQDNEQSLIASQMYTEANFSESIAFVHQHQSQLASVITATYPVQAAPDAFRAAASGSEIKVQLAG